MHSMRPRDCPHPSGYMQTIVKDSITGDFVLEAGALVCLSGCVVTCGGGGGGGMVHSPRGACFGGLCVDFG